MRQYMVLRGRSEKVMGGLGIWYPSSSSEERVIRGYRVEGRREGMAASLSIAVLPSASSHASRGSIRGGMGRGDGEQADGEEEHGGPGTMGSEIVGEKHDGDEEEAGDTDVEGRVVEDIVSTEYSRGVMV